MVGCWSKTNQFGTLDGTSGDVVLDGTVTAGAHKGASTHDEGTPTGPGAYDDDGNAATGH